MIRGVKAVMTHDEIISNLFAEYDKVSKKRVVELFLSSLSTRKLLWRIGLPIIAIMRTFPNHLFCVANNSVPSDISPCQVCGDFQCLYETEEDICEFLDGGGVLAHSIGDYYYGLKAINSLPSSPPQEVDIGIFHKIIACLKHSSGSIRIVQRELKNIPNFKSNVEERRLLLETLGYCGVLCPLEHPSPYSHYVRLNNAPRTSHSSDWNYPADFWKGRDGVNLEALNFWFGDYLL